MSCEIRVQKSRHEDTTQRFSRRKIKIKLFELDHVYQFQIHRKIGKWTMPGEKSHFSEETIRNKSATYQTWTLTRHYYYFHDRVFIILVDSETKYNALYKTHWHWWKLTFIFRQGDKQRVPNAQWSWINNCYLMSLFRNGSVRIIGFYK